MNSIRRPLCRHTSKRYLLTHCLWQTSMHQPSTSRSPSLYSPCINKRSYFENLILFSLAFHLYCVLSTVFLSKFNYMIIPRSKRSGWRLEEVYPFNSATRRQFKGTGVRNGPSSLVVLVFDCAFPSLQNCTQKWLFRNDTGLNKFVLAAWRQRFMPTALFPCVTFLGIKETGSSISEFIAASNVPGILFGFVKYLLVVSLKVRWTASWRMSLDTADSHIPDILLNSNNYPLTPR